MLGGGTGPAHGTLATTCTPGSWHLSRMLQAADAFNEHLLVKEMLVSLALIEMVNAGACACDRLIFL